MTGLRAPRKPRCSFVPLAVGSGHFALVFLAGLLIAFTCTIGKADELDPASLKQELRTLSEQLRTVHPDPFAVISAQDFEALTEKLVSRIDAKTTQADQLWNFSRLLAAVGCGHTNLGFFNQEDSLIEPDERFPVDVRFVGKRLFVIDPLVNSDRVALGVEIESINGLSVMDLRETIFDHIAADHYNRGAQTSYANAYATGYLTYALSFPKSYAVTVQGSGTATVLRPLTTFRHRPLIDPGNPCQETLCLHLGSDGIAVMTIRNWDFYGERIADFEQFVDDSFRTLAEQQLERLIIDVRGNLGGSSSATAYLLRHLAETPFTYFAKNSAGNPALKDLLEPSALQFDGKVFILANSQTGSSTGHFLALIKEHELATLIGSPSGAGSRVHDNKRRFTSEVSELRYRIARNTFTAATPELGEVTVVEPDIALGMTVADLLTDQDTVLARARLLVKEQAAAGAAR